MKTIKVISEKESCDNIASVQVEINETIEVSNPTIVTEQGLRDTIKFLNEKKESEGAKIDEEIAINQSQLDMVLNIDRSKFVKVVTE